MGAEARDRMGLGWYAEGFALSAAAFAWRRLRRSTTFVAVTGTAGKSTAVRFLAAMLGSTAPTMAMDGVANNRHAVARAVLRTRRRHRFTVLEVASKVPGTLRRAALAIRPDVVVVLNVRPMHTNRFATLDAMAAEKAKIVRGVPASGVIVLNRDDPRVMAMSALTAARVVTFGSDRRADVWWSDASSVWPDRLAFTVHYGRDSQRVATRLVGEHWAVVVTAALGAAVACGIELAAAVAAAADLEPAPARLEPVPLPSGAVLLRDECNASVTTYGPALAILAAARGVRRVAVVGDTWDSGLGEPGRHEALGRAVAASADLAVFVGAGSEHAARAAMAAGMEPGRVYFPETLPVAARLLGELTGDGDLVLLKGQVIQHLSRLYLAQIRPIACWRTTCQRMRRCDLCPSL